MTTEEYNRRIDGRPALYVARALGLTTGNEPSKWQRGVRPVPKHQVDAIRRRFPLRDDDVHHTGYLAGYTAAKLDAQHAISQLTP